MGQDAKDKTKAAYKEHVVDEVNNFGKNRGLVVEKLVLRDEEGYQVEVNACKANTYENLNAAEKKRVEIASRWKDRTRNSDRAYSSLSKVGTFPAASHVKSYEQELNGQVGKILPVKSQFLTILPFNLIAFYRL